MKKIMNSHVKHIFTMQIETRLDLKMTPIQWTPGVWDAQRGRTGHLFMSNPQWSNTF